MVSEKVKTRIETKDTSGNVNGWLLPIWNALEEPELRPQQVYATTITPHMRKGPHLHMKRRGYFACVKGSAVIAIRLAPDSYVMSKIGPGDEPVFVPATYPCALYNYGCEEAILINLTSPAWSEDEPDEHPVTGWEDPDEWTQMIKREHALFTRFLREVL